MSASMAVALLALFVALGGVGIAATGGNFILGVPNTATSPTELSASGGKVGDADTLDGIDSTGFLRGGGGADGQAVALSPNTIAFVGPAFGGLVRLRYTCPFGIG